LGEKKKQRRSTKREGGGKRGSVIPPFQLRKESTRESTHLSIKGGRGEGPIVKTEKWNLRKDDPAKILF